MLKTKLKNENIGYALYPVKEVQNLYSCKIRYESLLKELEQLQKENWHLKQLLLRTSKNFGAVVDKVKYPSNPTVFRAVVLDLIIQFF